MLTYQEQLEIEKLNKEIIDKIVKTVLPEDFINFYLCHNQKETMTEYGLRTTKQLTKVLKLFNYDFSKPKPSKFKDKTAARSHESYLAGGKKSSETQKQNWSAKAEEEKINWAKKQALAHSTKEFKDKIKQINLNYQASLTEEEKNKIIAKKKLANKATWDSRKKEILAKAYKTKKLNKSFNTSTPEDIYYKKLSDRYGIDNVLRQYKDDRYPFACDFYIKTLDLFIELNFSWTHGGHKFNEANAADIAKLSAWKEKATTSKYYEKAIDTWVRLDIKKFETAKKNNLNYKVYYTEQEAYDDQF